MATPNTPQPALPIPQSPPVNPGVSPPLTQPQPAPTSGAGASKPQPQQTQTAHATHYPNLIEAARALENAPSNDPAVGTIVTNVRNKIDAVFAQSKENKQRAFTIFTKESKYFQDAGGNFIVRGHSDPANLQKRVAGALDTIAQATQQQTTDVTLKSMSDEILANIPEIPKPAPATTVQPSHAPAVPAPSTAIQTQPAAATPAKKPTWWEQWVNGYQKFWSHPAKWLSWFLKEEKTSKFDAFSPGFFLRKK